MVVQNTWRRLTNDLKVGTFVRNFSSIHSIFLAIYLIHLWTAFAHLHRCDTMRFYPMVAILPSSLASCYLPIGIQDIIEFECDIVPSVNSMLSSANLQFILWWFPAVFHFESPWKMFADHLSAISSSVKVASLLRNYSVFYFRLSHISNMFRSCEMFAFWIHSIWRWKRFWVKEWIWNWVRSI